MIRGVVDRINYQNNEQELERYLVIHHLTDQRMLLDRHVFVFVSA